MTQTTARRPIRYLDRVSHPSHPGMVGTVASPDPLPHACTRVKWENPVDAAYAYLRTRELVHVEPASDEAGAGPSTDGAWIEGTRVLSAATRADGSALFGTVVETTADGAAFVPVRWDAGVGEESLVLYPAPRWLTRVA